jgi:hypothetical protein
MTDRDAMEATRAFFAALALLVGARMWLALRRDLTTARTSDHATAGPAQERARRMVRMLFASRRASSYVLMATGLLTVALMAIADHPLLAVASNINQIIQGVMLLRLTEMEGHARESLVNLAEAVPPEQMEPMP